MASPFKIPKRPASDSDSVLMTSPLSRLQGNGHTVKSLSPFREWTLSGNSSSPKALRRTSNYQRLELRSRHPETQPLPNGWRPKRASDRLLSPSASAETHSSARSAQDPSPKPISVHSVDSLAELRAEWHHGSSPPTDRKWSRRQDTPNKEQEGNSSSSLSKTLAVSSSPASSSLMTEQSVWSDLSDIREKQREKWHQFKEKKQSRSSISLKTRKNQIKTSSRTNSTEPIVLSSEEEDEESEKTSRINPSLSSEDTQVQVTVSERLSEPYHSFLQLDFTCLHLGLDRVRANGAIMISESGIILPLKGEAPGSKGELCVVASQLRGYGLWDGGVAMGAALLRDSSGPAHSPPGPAPSLLFLWVSEAQAQLLQTDLTEVQPVSPGPLCCFLILVLRDQLSDLDSALLVSVLDLEDYRKSRSRPCPIDWTEGLALVHSCPPPLDQHLLSLIRPESSCSPHKDRVRTNKTPQRSTRSCLRSGSQQLPQRLIQFPAAPSKGRISVSSEDLLCLNQGEFLNDVIIDFYLKYLLLEGVGGAVAQKSHVFSSFFYKQLSKRRMAGEDGVASVPDRHTRHQRVKTWTRNVDIFTKDFLFVPVNQEAHWFLVLVCFPGLEELRHEDFDSETVSPGFGVGSQTPPECTLKGYKKNRVLKRPCILVMDSLKLTYHENVCRLLRDYLQVEWQVRRGTPRLFTPDSMKSCKCRVPLQDNSSDCGLYLLQFAQSFLQNPVVNFDLPVRLETWFPRQQVRDKRQEIRTLVLRLHREQNQTEPDQD